MKGSRVIFPSILIVYLFISINSFSNETVEPMFKKQVKEGVVVVAQPYTGYLVSYYESGKVKIKENYIEGILIGKIEYYENGEILNAETYEQNREKVEKSIALNRALNKKNEGADEYKEYVTYYENGQMREKAVYVSGKIDGDYSSYYENGSLKEEGKYEMGTLVGEYKAYYDTEQLRVRKNYVKGELHGDYTWYYENGQIKEKIHYNMGKPDGESALYYKNGQVEKVESYSNGELLQETVYYSDGQLMFQEIYADAGDEREVASLEELEKAVEELVTVEGKNGEEVKE